LDHDPPEITGAEDSEDEEDDEDELDSLADGAWVSVVLAVSTGVVACSVVVLLL